MNMLNIPNVISLGRVIVIPLFLFFLVQDSLQARVIAGFIFAFAALSDLLDGYLARKYNQETKLGSAIDSVADKALVISTLLVFIYLDPQIPLWMVLVIIGRDILITLMRYLGTLKKTPLRTSKFGKIKTVFHMISIVLIILIFTVRSYRSDIRDFYTNSQQAQLSHLHIATQELLKIIRPQLNHVYSKKDKQVLFARTVPYFLMLFITLLSLISGINYCWANYNLLLPPYRNQKGIKKYE